jgi:hypothetical protein
VPQCRALIYQHAAERRDAELADRISAFATASTATKINRSGT